MYINESIILHLGFRVLHMPPLVMYVSEAAGLDFSWFHACHRWPLTIGWLISRGNTPNSQTVYATPLLPKGHH